jgi:hypothetical protein
MSEPTDPVYAELERIQNNLTALHATLAPGWVSAPNMRGTSSILYSCVLTLFACIYTALHLNVPKSGSTAFHLLFTKVKWSLLALFAPELVVYYASSQFFQARRLAKDMRKLYESKVAAVTDLNSEKVGSSLSLPPDPGIGAPSWGAHEECSTLSTSGGASSLSWAVSSSRR